MRLAQVYLSGGQYTYHTSRFGIPTELGYSDGVACQRSQRQHVGRLPFLLRMGCRTAVLLGGWDRGSHYTIGRSHVGTQLLMGSSYDFFCLKKKIYKNK